MNTADFVKAFTEAMTHEGVEEMDEAFVPGRRMGDHGNRREHAKGSIKYGSLRHDP